MVGGHLIPKDHRQIAEFVSTNHRRLLGRGPFRTTVQIVNDFIIVEAEGVLNKMEQILASDEINHETLADLRRRLYTLSLPQWRDCFQAKFGVDLVSLTCEPDINNDKETLKLVVKKL